MNRIIILLILITALAGSLRFYALATNPVSLNIDEISSGYDAFSILKTGRDQYGNFLPLSFKSTGDYKNPVFIYLLVPFIKVFGLSDFGVRFSSALIGTLFIPAIYFLTTTLTKNRSSALASALLLAISPWHIYYSRLANDIILAAFFLVLGVACFLKSFPKPTKWIVPAAFLLALSMLTYHAERVFVPLFIVFILYLNRRHLHANRRSLSLFAILFILFNLPLAYTYAFGPAAGRTNQVFISTDIFYSRYLNLSLNLLTSPLSLIFFWTQRYLHYLSPEFLLIRGLNMTNSGIGLGAIFLFEFALLIFGIWQSLRQRQIGLILIFWLLVGLIPTSLTNNEFNPGRSFLILPALIILVSIGLVEALKHLPRHHRIVTAAISITCLAVISLELIHAFLTFAVYFPRERGEAFMEGSRQSVLYAIQHQDDYNEIIYDPKRGVAAGDIINIPETYFLFYSQYDPAQHQQDILRPDGKPFNKFSVRPIYWITDRYQKGKLFIASPWSISPKDLSQDEILQKIYLTNGQLALLIVTPKPELHPK